MISVFSEVLFYLTLYVFLLFFYSKSISLENGQIGFKFTFCDEVFENFHENVILKVSGWVGKNQSRKLNEDSSIPSKIYHRKMNLVFIGPNWSDQWPIMDGSSYLSAVID